MGRKRKNSASISDIEPIEEDLETQEVEPIEEDLEAQDEAPGSLIDKARGILSSGIGNVQEKLGTEGRTKKKWISPAKRAEQEKNVTTLVTSLVVMLVAGWKVPDELKPNDVEMSAVSGCSTSILLRHVNISGRLTQDVIDVIGIVATVAAYVSRTSPAWRVYREGLQAAAIAPLNEAPTPEPPAASVDVESFMRP